MNVSDFFKKKTKEYPSGAKKNTLKGHLFRARILAAAAVLSGASLSVSAQTDFGKSQTLKKQILAEAFEKHSISAQGDTLLTYKVLGGQNGFRTDRKDGRFFDGNTDRIRCFKGFGKIRLRYCNVAGNGKQSRALCT